VNEEPLEFCARIMAAARRVRYVMEYLPTNEGFVYTFIDTVAGSRIAGKPCKTKEEALVSTCEELEKFWQVAK
jgi:hypothetical protein